MMAPVSNQAWLFRFVVVMMPLVWLVGLRYLPWMTVDGVLPPVYVALLFLGHFSLFPLLALLPLLLLVRLPAALFRGLAVAMGTLLLVALLVDTLVYALYRFHMNSFVLEMVLLSGTDTFSLAFWTWVAAAAGLLVLVAITWLAGRWLAPRLPASLVRRSLAVVALALVLVHGIHAWADARYEARITDLSRHVPLYFGATGKRLFVDLGLADPELQRDRLRVNRSSSLQYPQQPLQCEAGSNLNVLVVLVDALRADTLTPRWTPHMAAFAERASRFERHFSGGNSTLAGVFSLFYGLPSNYWDAFYGAQRPPVLVERLQQTGYQMQILSSATLISPAFDRTVFAGVDGIRLRTPGKAMWQKDRRITDDWLAFTAARQANDAPFFGFLFYSAVHAYGPPPDYPRFEPFWDEINHLKLSRELDPEPYFNVYRTAAHYVDSLVGEVLADLEQRGLLDSTLVILSSDHGEEFNDNGLGFWGHGSNFSDVQLQVPMVVHWPGREARRVDHRTSHFDVPVTLMEELLGCAATPAASYASGHNLYRPGGRELLITGSYANYAAVTDQHIVVSYPTGGHDVLDKQLRKVSGGVLNADISRHILTELSRFYR